MQASLQSGEFREIIRRGIISHCKDKNSIKIVQSICNNISKMNINLIPNSNDKLSSSHQISNSSGDVYHKTLSIQSIICKVFSYLDVKSCCRCSRVNTQWLYDSYQPSSIYKIDLDKLFIIDPKYSNSRPNNLSRFKNIESLQTGRILHIAAAVRKGQGKYTMCQKYVQTLHRVKKLNVIDSVNRYRRAQSFIDTMAMFMSQNSDHLQSIKITNTNKRLSSSSVNHSVYNVEDDVKDASIWTYLCNNIKKFSKLQEIELYCHDIESSLSSSVFPQCNN